MCCWISGNVVQSPVSLVYGAFCSHLLIKNSLEEINQSVKYRRPRSVAYLATLIPTQSHFASPVFQSGLNHSFFFYIVHHQAYQSQLPLINS